MFGPSSFTSYHNGNGEMKSTRLIRLSFDLVKGVILAIIVYIYICSVSLYLHVHMCLHNV